MPEENPDDEQPKVTEEYHASFNSDHADLVLRSKDGVKFRVHSQILRVASSVFNDMLSVKRDESETSSSPIDLEESGIVLTMILDLIYPQHVLPASSKLTTQLIYDTGQAARKYDIDSVTDSLQNCLYTREVMQPLSSIQKFGVAKRLGWDEVARWASTDTLALDLSTSASQTALLTLETASVLALQSLHRRRKVLLVNALLNTCKENLQPSDPDDPVYTIHLSQISNVNHSSDGTCDAVTQLKDLAAWSKFKFAVMAEMERCALGSRFRNDDFFDNVEFAGLWTVKLSCACWASSTIDKSYFKTEFRSVLSKLPTAVPQETETEN